METKHTPGKWKACQSIPKEAAWEGVDEWIQADDETIVCEKPAAYPSQSDVWDANARLIAAAPELLEALKDAANNLELIQLQRGENSLTKWIVVQARAAIAKAEGVQL